MLFGDVSQKIRAAKLRIAEAEKASEKRLKAIRKEKKQSLRRKGQLLKEISDCETEIAKKQNKLKEKDVEIETVTKELSDISKELDKVASEWDDLDNTVTTTEVVVLLKHLLYKVTPKGKNRMKLRCGQFWRSCLGGLQIAHHEQNLAVTKEVEIQYIFVDRCNEEPEPNQGERCGKQSQRNHAGRWNRKTPASNVQRFQLPASSFSFHLPTSNVGAEKNEDAGREGTCYNEGGNRQVRGNDPDGRTGGEHVRPPRVILLSLVPNGVARQLNSGEDRCLDRGKQVFSFHIWGVP